MRRLLAGFGAGSGAAAAKAQQAGRVYRVGVLSPFSPSFDELPSFEAFRQSARDLGYVEGRRSGIASRQEAP
jgi:hypothetical protein